MDAVGHLHDVFDDTLDALPFKVVFEPLMDLFFTKVPVEVRFYSQRYRRPTHPYAARLPQSPKFCARNRLKRHDGCQGRCRAEYLGEGSSISGVDVHRNHLGVILGKSRRVQQKEFSAYHILKGDERHKFLTV